MAFRKGVGRPFMAAKTSPGGGPLLAWGDHFRQPKVVWGGGGGGGIFGNQKWSGGPLLTQTAFGVTVVPPPKMELGEIF